MPLWPPAIPGAKSCLTFWATCFYLACRDCSDCAAVNETNCHRRPVSGGFPSIGCRPPTAISTTLRLDPANRADPVSRRARFSANPSILQDRPDLHPLGRGGL